MFLHRGGGGTDRIGIQKPQAAKFPEEGQGLTGTEQGLGRPGTLSLAAGKGQGAETGMADPSRGTTPTSLCSRLGGHPILVSSTYPIENRSQIRKLGLSEEL